MEESTVEIRGDAWRLNDVRAEIDWCKSRAWKAATFLDAGQHAHCLICSWSIMPSDDPTVGQGYVSGPHSWLCGVCYGKFVAPA